MQPSSTIHHFGGVFIRFNQPKNMDFGSPDLQDWALRFVRRRCSDLSEKEIEEAAQNLLAYMEVVWDIYRRISEERR
jgi:hypothetical protein